jgi:integrase
MGSVFRKCVTRPIPPAATMTTQGGRRVARWRTRAAKWASAEVLTRPDGREFIRVESGTFFAKYRDGDGMVRVVPTGCRDESAARQILADLERQSDRVRAGVITTQELAVADRMSVPISQHIAEFISTLTGSTCYRDNTDSYLRRLAADCRWGRLSDLRRSDMECWLADQSRQGRGARSRNAFREALLSFCNWCVRDRRLTVNPFDRMPKANTDADPRRRRRALTEDEIGRLLDVARQRPILDALTVRRGVRKGQQVGARLSDDHRRVLEATGRFRALVYRTFLLTGLRKRELARLTVADLYLDAPVPHIQLPAKITKNGEEDFVPLRADLVAELKGWLVERFGPGDPPPNGRLFDIPSDLLRVFNRDLKAAGIPKRDERGRTVDVHALRTTFGTLLSRSGVPPRVAQRLMRHSDIRLTMQTYTDPKLFDLQGAIDSLPSVAPSVAPTPVISGATESSHGNKPIHSRSPQVQKPHRKRLIS